MSFVLDTDAAKNHPVLSSLTNIPGKSSTEKTYAGYESVSGRWVPTTITIDKYNDREQPPELLSHDEWNINSIDAAVPAPDEFKVFYEPGTIVEYRSPLTAGHLSYRYSGVVDTDALLEDRIAIVSSPETQIQNCATIAIKYIAEQSGMTITDQQLANLITDPNRGTSLYELRQFAQELGFNCLAVKTDLTTLKSLNTYQAILHLPGPDHYVVLDHIDDKYVWIVDLDNDKFYYRTRRDTFSLDWDDAVALLLGEEPLNNPQGNLVELSDEQLLAILGGSANYSCSDQIQTYNVVFCAPMFQGYCGGTYVVFYDRYGCEEDPNGGSCSGDDLVGNVSNYCVEDPYDPCECGLSGTYIFQDIRACQ